MRWRCPHCQSDAMIREQDEYRCSSCDQRTVFANDILRCISAQRMDHFRDFLQTYNKVRLAEGRGTLSPDMLRNLPQCPSTHALAGQWKIRSASFAALMQLLRSHVKSNGRILDLGAGTGWLSHRLAQAGFRPCAIDLRDDGDDGLGAAVHFDPDWPRVQAELDCIPIAGEQADAVIYNASFHYYEDQSSGIAEALRVLVPGGLLIILDSPIYADATSGEKMLEEQQEYFMRLIGQRSDALKATGFLTWQWLESCTTSYGLEWHFERPWYGLRWALRPLLAKLRGQREPATFAIAWAKKPK